MLRHCLLLTAVALLTVGAFTLASAQPATPAFGQDIVLEFPDSITFLLRDLPSGMEEAVVVYAVERRSCSRVEGRGFADPPGTSGAVQWELDLRQAGGLPPGTVFRYHWELRDVSGGTQTTVEESLTFDDRRYPWREASRGRVRLRWYDGDEAFAQALLDTAERTLDTLFQETETRLEEEVTLYVYGSTADLHAALVFPQEWTGGMAFPQYQTITIGISPGQVAWGRGALAHELAHLVVHQATFNCYNRVPSWLDEGLATWAEGDVRADYRYAMDLAIENDSLYPARGLSDGFPTRSDEARLAYAQSLALVDYLLQAHGTEAMRRLLEGFRSGMSDDAALLQSYGFDQDGLDSQWRKWMGLPAQIPAPGPTVPPVTSVPSTAQTPTVLSSTLSPSNLPSATIPSSPLLPDLASSESDVSPPDAQPLRFLECTPSGEASGSLSLTLPMALAGGIFLWRRGKR